MWYQTGKTFLEYLLQIEEPIWKGTWMNSFSFFISGFKESVDPVQTDQNMKNQVNKTVSK